MDFTKLTAERICMIKPSAFGDVVQALPLLEGLRRRFPAARIAWVINTELADLVAGHPLLDDVITFRRHGSWFQQAELLRTLRGRRFDLVLDLQGLLRTAVMTFATGAPWRLGLETAREGAAWSCTHILPGTGSDVAAHARYWNVAQILGAEGQRPAAQLAIPVEALSAAESLLAPLRVGGRPVLAVHPGAKWETKRWPAAKFAEVLRGVAPDVSIVVVGTAAERPIAETLVSAVLARGGRALDLTGRTALKPLAAVLQRCGALLSNDSGPLHLAAEMGTPVVGLYTCTSAVRSGPPAGVHILLEAPVPCAAGYHKVCPHTGGQRHACFDALDVFQVTRALRHVLRIDERTAKAA